MYRKKWRPTLTKLEISRLRGGKKRNRYYFVGICETAESDLLTDVLYVKLRNQMGSQRSLWSFPDGYEPFQTSYGIERFCLWRMTMPAPRLKLCLNGWPKPAPLPRIITELKPACVLNPSRSTEAFHALRAEAKGFEIKHRIRCHAAENRAKLDLVLSLMAYGGSVPFCTDPADQFEAYLCLRGLEFLRDLLKLLDIPDSAPKPTGPEMPRAA